MKPLPLAIVFVLVTLGRADAQRPAAVPVQPQAQEAPTPPANYEYRPDGRRDPFVSLVNRGTDGGQAPPTGARPDGIAGLLVDEIVVRGVVQSRGGWLAIVGSPSGRTYSIRPGDQLMDGEVREITGQVVVLMQHVDDPLSLAKAREVRKYLRGEVK